MINKRIDIIEKELQLIKEMLSNNEYFKKLEFGIDRVNKRNKELEDKVEDLMTLYTTEREVKDYYKNIINELEKWLEERLEKLDINGYDDDVFNGIEIALHKLQELKGSNKE